MEWRPEPTFLGVATVSRYELMVIHGSDVGWSWAPAVAAAEPKSQQGAIVITGLADGPREIPVGK